MGLKTQLGFPHSSVSKESACNAGDLGSIPGSGRSSPVILPGNPVDRGAWRATVHRVARVGHDLVTKPPPLQDTVGLGLQGTAAEV